MDYQYEEIVLDGGYFSIAYDHQNNRILACEVDDCKIDIIEFKDNKLKFLKSVELKEHLRDAFAIAVNTKGEIYVACKKKNGLHVFDSDFKKLKSFKDIKVESAKSIIFNSDESELFISDHREDIILRINIATETIIKQYELDSPLSMGLSGDKLIAYSYRDLYIFDLDKHIPIKILYMEHLAKCDLVTDRTFGGMFIDKKCNMYFCLQNYDSQFKFLLVLDKDFNVIINNYPLHGMIEVVIDMIVMENNLFILSSMDEFDFSLHRFTLNNQILFP